MSRLQIELFVNLSVYAFNEPVDGKKVFIAESLACRYAFRAGLVIQRACEYNQLAVDNVLFGSVSQLFGFVRPGRKERYRQLCLSCRPSKRRISRCLLQLL